MNVVFFKYFFVSWLSDTNVSGLLKLLWNSKSGRKSKNMEYFDRAGFPKHSNLQTCYSSVAIIFTFLSENSPLDSWRHLISYMIFCLFHWFEKWARPESAKISHMPLDYPDTQKPESLNLWCLKLNLSISILYLIFTVICQGHTESL